MSQTDSTTLSTRDGEPPPYRPPTINELGSFTCPVDVRATYNTARQHLDLTTKPQHVIPYEKSQLACSPELVLHDVQDDIPRSPVTRNATMRAVTNTSTNVGFCFNNPLPALAIDQTLQSHVYDPSLNENEATTTTHRSRALGVFHPLAPSSEEYVSGHAEIKQLLRNIKQQLREKKTYGKSGPMDKDNPAVRAVGPQLAWEMETLASILGRPPVAEECQQQPYSISKIRPYDEQRGLEGAGLRYNIDYSTLCARGKARARRDRDRKIRAKTLLSSLGDIDAQLALGEHDHEDLANTGTHAADDDGWDAPFRVLDAEYSAEEASDGEGDVDNTITSTSSAGHRVHSQIGQAAMALKTPGMTGTGASGQVLGNLSQYGYHGRNAAPPPGTGSSGLKSSMGARVVVRVGDDDTARAEAFEHALVTVGVKSHGSYSKIRASVMLEELRRGVMTMDVAGVPLDVLEATIRCLDLPFHTICLHDSSSARERIHAEQKYKKKIPQKRFTTAAHQPGSAFGLPEYTAPTPSRNNPNSGSGSMNARNSDLSQPPSPYALCRMLSTKLPRTLASHAPTLQHLELIGLTLTPAAWSSIFTSITHMPLLRVVHIRQCNITEEHVVTLVGSMSNLSITHVAVAGCGLGPAAAYSFARLLGSQAQRRESYRWKTTLRSYNAPEDTPGPVPPRRTDAAVTSALQPLGLLSLDISHNRMGDKAVAEFLRSLCADTWLLALDISGNGVDAETVSALGELLSLNASLLRVRIDGGAHAQALVESLDPLLPLRLAKVLAWYAEPAILAKSSDTGQMQRAHNALQQAMQNRPEWTGADTEETEGEHKEGNNHENSGKIENSGKNDDSRLPMPVLSAIPPYGANGGRLLMPILDLPCSPQYMLQPLSHVRNNGRITQTGAKARGGVVEMGVVYREAVDEDRNGILPGVILDAKVLIAPLQSNVRSRLLSRPTTARAAGDTRTTPSTARAATEKSGMARVHVPPLPLSSTTPSRTRNTSSRTQTATTTVRGTKTSTPAAPTRGNSGTGARAGTGTGTVTRNVARASTTSLLRETAEVAPAAVWRSPGEVEVSVPTLLHELEGLVKREQRHKHQQDMQLKEKATGEARRVGNNSPGKDTDREIPVLHERLATAWTGDEEEDVLIASSAASLADANPYWANVIDALQALIQPSSVQPRVGEQKGEGKDNGKVMEPRRKDVRGKRVGGGFFLNPDPTPTPVGTGIGKTFKSPSSQPNTRVVHRSTPTRPVSVSRVSTQQRHITASHTPEQRDTLKPSAAPARATETVDVLPGTDNPLLSSQLGLTEAEFAQLSSGDALQNPILAEALSHFLKDPADYAVYANVYMRALGDAVGLDRGALRDLRENEKDEAFAAELVAKTRAKSREDDRLVFKGEPTGAYPVLKQLQRYLRQSEYVDDDTVDRVSNSIGATDGELRTIEDVEVHPYQALDREFFNGYDEDEYLKTVDILQQYTHELYPEEA